MPIKNVLLVDDDADFLYQMSLQFEARGYDVIALDGVKAATAYLEENKPDLAVIDLMMETTDGGFILAQTIKRKSPSTPVLLVTGVSSDTGIDFEESPWIKADAILEKPVRFEQIERVIQKLVH